MKIALVFLVACLFGSRSERIVLHTKTGANKAYNFFPLRTNLLQISVKASNAIFVALSNTYDINSAYYEIVIGAWHNTRSVIAKDNTTHGYVAEYNGTVITREKFQDYWIAINDREGSISVGKSHGTPFLYYRDPDYVKMSYFGLSSGYGEGQWNFDFDMLRPQAIDINQHNNPRCETIEAN